ncbi:MAG: RNA polymerase sigma factor [Planctomycetota bacterium]|nr:MAG: RNA polymerase sigma factor [Planctomycetota bacterium]
MSPRNQPEEMKTAAPAAYGPAMEAEATRLMREVKRGDAGAFDHLVALLGPSTARVAQGFVGSREDALDLSQDAFLKVFRARASFRDEEAFLPWFHRILRNTCFSHLRRQGRLRPATGQADDGGEPDFEIADLESESPAEGAAGSELARDFWRAFRGLSARDREILVLRHFQSASYRDIARVLAIPEGTVMSRLFHARRRLREKLAPHLAGIELGAPDKAEPAGRRRA